MWVVYQVSPSAASFCDISDSQMISCLHVSRDIYSSTFSVPLSSGNILACFLYIFWLRYNSGLIITFKLDKHPSPFKLVTAVMLLSHEIICTPDWSNDTEMFSALEARHRAWEGSSYGTDHNAAGLLYTSLKPLYRDLDGKWPARCVFKCNVSRKKRRGQWMSSKQKWFWIQLNLLNLSSLLMSSVLLTYLSMSVMLLQPYRGCSKDERKCKLLSLVLIRWRH